MRTLRHHLTPQVAHEIVSFIRAGGYPQVAAEAAGIPGDVFERWLERGRRRHARGTYRTFAGQVRQAAAVARLGAEVEALKKDPRFWLRHGPGRETEARRGWTGPVRPTALPGPAGGMPAGEECVRLVTTILDALGPFPEAHDAILRAIDAPEPAPGRGRRPRPARGSADGQGGDGVNGRSPEAV